MSKYELLKIFLKSLDDPNWRASFSDIERILGFKLPKSARSYPAWWSNDETGHSHARAWLDAGRRTQDVDISKERMTLVRTGEADFSRKDPWGCMAGTVRVLSGTDLTAPSGETWNADMGRLGGE